MTGTRGTGRAQRRQCLPSQPPGGRSGKARRSSGSSALPSLRGAGTSPGSPAVRGGSPAVQRPLERGCTDRSAGGCADRYTAATIRARATAAGHRRPARGLAAPHKAGAARRRRRISRRAARSADCGADCPPAPDRASAPAAACSNAVWCMRCTMPRRRRGRERGANAAAGCPQSLGKTGRTGVRTAVASRG